MSDREILFRWLTKAASRLSWNRRVHDLAGLAWALVALWFAAEVLEAIGLPAPVLTALASLLLIAALLVVAWFTWRLVRPTSLTQAAEAADRSADLKDELKSAHWFAQGGPRNAFVDVLLTRAAQTAQTLDARRLFPMGVPRSAFSAFGLAVVAGSLAWLSPRIALPVMKEPVAASAQPASVKNLGGIARADPVEKIAAQPLVPDAPAKQESAALLQTGQVLEQPLFDQEQETRAATAARDAKVVDQLLQLLRGKPKSAGEQVAHGDVGDTPPGGKGEAAEGLPEPEKKDIVPAPEPAQAKFAEPTARVQEQLRQQAREEQRKLQGQPAEGLVQYNSRMRAVSGKSSESQEVTRAEGQAALAGANTSIDGEAKGPNRGGPSKAGGTSGEAKEPPVSAEGDKKPLLGAQTPRLAKPVAKVRVERNDEQQLEATQEDFYAATQRHASKLDYENIVAEWRSQHEATLTESRTPLSYRDAVKRYFLTEHGKEDAKDAKQ